MGAEIKKRHTRHQPGTTSASPSAKKLHAAAPHSPRDVMSGTGAHGFSLSPPVTVPEPATAAEPQRVGHARDDAACVLNHPHVCDGPACAQSRVHKETERAVQACVEALCVHGVRAYVTAGLSTDVSVIRKNPTQFGPVDACTSLMHCLVAAAPDNPSPAQRSAATHIVRLLVSGGLHPDAHGYIEPHTDRVKAGETVVYSFASGPSLVSAAIRRKFWVVQLMVRAGSTVGCVSNMLAEMRRVHWTFEFDTRHVNALEGICDQEMWLRSMWASLNAARDSLDDELELYDGQVLFDDHAHAQLQALLAHLAFQPDEVVEHVLHAALADRLYMYGFDEHV